MSTLPPEILENVQDLRSHPCTMIGTWPVSTFSYTLSLKFIVVETRIEARLSILEFRASITRASRFDISVVTVTLTPFIRPAP